MNKVLAWLVSIGLAGAVSAFAQAQQSSEDLARAYNNLGFHLMAQCRQSISKPNYFLSPAGLAFALSMVQNGAKGQTWSEIMATMQVGNLTPSQLNDANKVLLKRLANLDPKIQLEIANALWIDQKASIKPEFMAVNRQAYNAEVANADFQNPATIKDINGWASERTHGKIQTILEPPLDPMLRVILLNAIYFKGDWESPFDTNRTRNQPFTLAGGQTVQHPRMDRSGHYPYFENDLFQAVELPYSSHDVSMFVFLPKTGLDDFFKAFDEKYLEDSIRALRSRQGEVELPRFKLENEYDLTRTVSNMGMPLAFTVKSDFSGLSDELLFISFIKQKTYVNVNEEGTVAAAVTAIGVRALAVRREEPPFLFVVDRPFFIVIRERQTGLNLFMGAISDPR